MRVSGLCTLPINILNEKIYFILWVWYILLIIISVSLLIWEFFHILFPKLRLATLSRRIQRTAVSSRVVRSVFRTDLSLIIVNLRSEFFSQGHLMGISSCSSLLPRTLTRHSSSV